MPPKRKSTDDTGDEPPPKKATGNKGGRPRNVGEAQYRTMLAGYPDYLDLKKRKATPSQIGAFFDDKTFTFIGKYGWENPQRALVVDEADPSAEVVAAAKAAATAAENAVANRGKPISEAEMEEHSKKDSLVKDVRWEISRLYQRLARDGVESVETAKPASLDIPKLIKSVISKPTLRQLYLVWAKSKARPDLEAEVDQRFAEVAQTEGAATSRGAVWNLVAAEWYNAASEDEKEAVLAEATNALAEATERWEEQAAGEPETPEEAHEFMDGSREFLASMMQFFANRASGIAIMFLAGPNGVILSEAVMDVNGQPKVKYSEVLQEAETLNLMGERILTQSRLFNERKWGIAHANQAASTSNPNAGSEGVDAPTAEGSPTCAHNEYRHDAINAATQSGQGPQAAGGAPILPAQLGPDRIENPSSALTQNALKERHGRDNNGAGANVQKDNIVGPREVLAPEDTVRTGDTVASPAVCSGVGGSAATSRDSVVHGSKDAPPSSVPSATEELASARDQPPAPVGCASMLAFDIPTGLQGSQVNETAYKKAFEKASSAVTSFKAWYSELNTHNFLKNVPQKLAGKVDVDAGCDLALAYLDLENSAADEHPLAMLPEVENGPLLPAYMASFDVRKLTARWNKRMEGDGPRTGAALDADIHVTLPRQWARLQPTERLNAEGRIAAQPDQTMRWASGLAPGPTGVRLVVITLLNWGGAVKGAAEQAEWRLIAVDVARVLRILAAQAGPRRQKKGPAAPGGSEGSTQKKERKREASAKARDPNRVI